MKKLRAIIILVMVALMVTPGYASFHGFKKLVKAQKKESGHPQIYVESDKCIIIIFGLQKVMRKFKYYKITDTYEIKEITKIDTPPSDWDQTPQQRLREALVIYGIEKTTD